MKFNQADVTNKVVQSVLSFRVRLLKYFAIVWVGGSIFSSNQLEAEDPLSTRIAKLAMPYIENQIVIGMSIGVVQDGKHSVHGFGQLADTDSQCPDGNTIYEIASNTKTFTGVLLADAVVRGKMQLDHPVQQYLPEGTTMPSKGDVPITLKHLATHASGLPRIPDNMPMKNIDDPYADYSIEQMLDFLSSHKLRRRPVTQISYSNLGFGLLGWLLSREAGVSYEALLRDRVTGPLKMPDTVVVLSPSMQSRVARAHRVGGIETASWNIETLAGLGGLHSTANDMLIYLQANLQPPASDLGKAIELAWQMHQPKLSESEFDMGLGWHIARDGHTRWHTGQTGGFHSCMFIDRRSKSGVVVLANTAATEIDALGESLIRMLMGIEQKPREFEKLADVSPDIMRRYLGKYELVPEVVFTITTDGGKLLAGLTGQQTQRIFPRSEKEWFYRIVEATLTFKVDEKGQCNELELFQNGVRRTAKRIE
jgi:serine-type D-Ala-D-Ala carboxypeptidase/endopeptidase